MKTVSRIACVILLLNFFLAAKTILTIEEPFKIPILLKVDQGKAYILDGPKSVIHIYSISNTAEHFMIGRQGEGPGECKWINMMSLHNNKIVVSGSEKLLFFDKKGHFLNETKVPYAHTRIIPIGNKFVCRKYETFPEKTIISATVYDSAFSSKEKLEDYTIQRDYRGKNGKINAYFFENYFRYNAIDQFVIVGNTQKGFYFGVYNTNGKKLYEIKRKYKKCLITEDQKKSYIEHFKAIIGPTRFKKFSLQKNRVFPEFYPAYESFEVNQGKVYIRLYPMVEGYQPLLVLDAKGKKINEYKVPTFAAMNEFCIWNSHYYYIKENLEHETWELHSVSLN